MFYCLVQVAGSKIFSVTSDVPEVPGFRIWQYEIIVIIVNEMMKIKKNQNEKSITHLVVIC